MRSRIIATIGPASDKVDTLAEMMQAGMNIARLNYSHGDFEGKEQTIQNIRDAENNTGMHIGLLADLPGPKLRLGRFEGEVELLRGELVDLHCGYENGLPPQSATILGEMVKTLPVEWSGLSKDLQKGDPILLSDGLIRLEVLSAPDFEGEIVRCRVEDGGILTKRKGINVPRTLVKLPAVGPHDLDCLDHALCMNTDDPKYEDFKQTYGDRVIGFTKQDPTTEDIAKEIFEVASARLKEYLGKTDARYPLRTSVKLLNVRLWETSSSWAEYALDQ